MFSTTKLAENSSILSENEQFIHIPQPLPAVAYDYDDGDFDDEIGSNSIDQTSAINLEAQHDVVNNFLHDVTTSRRMGTEFLGTSGGTRRGPTSPYPPPSSVDASKSGPTRKASGGGGGEVEVEDAIVVPSVEPPLRSVVILKKTRFIVLVVLVGFKPTQIRLWETMPLGIRQMGLLTKSSLRKMVPRRSVNQKF